jgi:hypothetical protein
MYQTKRLERPALTILKFPTNLQNRPAGRFEQIMIARQHVMNSAHERLLVAQAFVVFCVDGMPCIRYLWLFWDVFRLNAYGIKISPTFVEAKARVLPPPVVEYKYVLNFHQRNQELGVLIIWIFWLFFSEIIWKFLSEMVNGISLSQIYNFWLQRFSNHGLFRLLVCLSLVCILWGSVFWLVIFFLWLETCNTGRWSSALMPTYPSQPWWIS